MELSEMKYLAETGQSLGAQGIGEEDMRAFENTYGRGRPALEPFKSVPQVQRAEIAAARLYAMENHKDLSKGKEGLEMINKVWQGSRPGQDMPGHGPLDDETLKFLEQDIVKFHKDMSPEELSLRARAVMTGRALQVAFSRRASFHKNEVMMAADPALELRKKVGEVKSETQGPVKSKVAGAASIFGEAFMRGDSESWPQMGRALGSLSHNLRRQSMDLETTAKALGADWGHSAVDVPARFQSNKRRFDNQFEQ